MVSNIAPVIFGPLYRGLAACLGVVAIVLRPAMRFVGALFLIAATIALTSDLTRWQSGTAPSWTFESLTGHLAGLAPATLKSLGKSVGQALHPWVWDPVLLALIGQPAWLLFAVTGTTLVYASRERKRVNVFIN